MYFEPILLIGNISVLDNIQLGNAKSFWNVSKMQELQTLHYSQCWWRTQMLFKAISILFSGLQFILV